MRTTVASIVLILALAFSACARRDADRLSNRGADGSNPKFDSAAREAGRAAYELGQESKKAAREAARKLREGGREARQGWSEAKHEAQAKQKE